MHSASLVASFFNKALLKKPRHSDFYWLLQLWKLSTAELSELAANSVRQSGLAHGNRFVDW